MAKRCKNCVFWNVYKGNEPTLPARAKRACTQRGATYEGPNGEPKNLVTSKFDFIQIKDGVRERVKTDPGPHYGQRTKPNFVCPSFVGKHQPKLKADAQPAVADIEVIADNGETQVVVEPMQEVNNAA